MGFGDGEASHWMQCTHRFHSYCVSSLAGVKTCAVSELVCPLCKTPACSDDAMLEKLATEHEKAMADEMPLQAINLEDTQEYPPVIDIDRADTAVRYQLVYPGDAEFVEPANVASPKPPIEFPEWIGLPNTMGEAFSDSQGSDNAPVLEVASREHKRRLEQGLRTEAIAKKSKAAPPQQKVNSKRAAHPLNAVAASNLASRKEAYARDKKAAMAKLLGAGPPKRKAEAESSDAVVSKPRPEASAAAVRAKPKAKSQKPEVSAAPVVPKPNPVEPPAAVGPKLMPTAAVLSKAKAMPTTAVVSKAEAMPTDAVVSKAEAMPKPSKSPALPPKPTCSTATPHAPELLQCDLCGSQVTKDSARVLSKKAETWKCGKCASSMTKLYRRPGGLPDDATWSTEKKQDFWKLMQQQSTTAAIEDVTALFTQSEYKKDESHYDNSGEYLPLSVWSQRGFSADDIAKHSIDANIRIDPVLGKTYRVVIQASGERGVHGSEEQRQHCFADAAKATPVAAPTLNELRKSVEVAASSQKAEDLQAKIQTKKIGDLVAQCGQLMSLCGKNPEMIPNNITAQANRLAQEVDEIKIRAATSDVTKAPPCYPNSLWVSIYNIYIHELVYVSRHNQTHMNIMFLPSTTHKPPFNVSSMRYGRSFSNQSLPRLPSIAQQTIIQSS